MSEDEILEIIKDYIDNGMTDKTVKLDTIIYLDEAIKELYNMYQKEKEKNSKYIIHLTDEQYRKVIDNAQRDIEEKWKDKIREKIEELEDECDNSNAYDTTWYEASINTLKELLEE